MAEIKFSEIKIGTFVLFNGLYAIKTKPNIIQIPKLGVDGFHYIENDEEIEIVKEGYDEYTANN